MKREDKFGGVLLKLERLRQGKGQKEICNGICVPSYLSKIERNLVQPDERILKELFGRLGICYNCDAELLKKTEEKVNEYFFQLSYGLEKTAYTYLLERDLQLTYSPFAIDWMLVQVCEGKDEIMDTLSQCTDAMTEVQLSRYYLSFRADEDAEKALQFYMKAFKVLNDSFSLICVMSAYWHLGEYDQVNRCANQCISMALEEGNTWNLANCYILQGTVYSCLSLDSLMISYYERAIYLLQNTYWKEQLSYIYYNIGATYINLHQYDKAIKYLEKVEKLDDFLIYHKKALVKIRSGHINEADEFLKLMERWLFNKQEDIEVELLMYKEVLMEMKKDFLSDQAYLDLLEKLVAALKQKRHPGYILFYREILKEAYCKQRKYKKALDLETEISNIILKLNV